MDWVLDNFHFAFAFIAAFIWWLTKRREGKAGGEEGAPPPLVMDDASFGDEERARRIQEEIRRKIAERRGQPPALEPPPMVMREIQVPQERNAEPVFDPMAAMLEQQRRVDDQMRLIEDTRRKAAAIRAQSPASPVRAKTLAVPIVARSRLIGDLRGATNLRRAIVLREILGPPKGLQA